MSYTFKSPFRETSRMFIERLVFIVNLVVKEELNLLLEISDF